MPLFLELVWLIHIKCCQVGVHMRNVTPIHTEPSVLRNLSAEPLNL